MKKIKDNCPECQFEKSNGHSQACSKDEANEVEIKPVKKKKK